MIYSHDRMLADKAWVERRKPWLPRRRFWYYVRWWGCMLRWLRWLEKNQPIAYALWTIHNSDAPKYKRAIAFAASKGWQSTLESERVG